MDSDLISLRQLGHFLAVVEHGHFGRAAQQLAISKQGISQSIAALESSLNARLFERGQFGAIPTEFGRVLIAHAKAMQAEARKARSEIEGLQQEHRGEVTCALGSSFSEFIAPRAICRFREAHPRVVLKIANVHPDNMLQLLREGELDFVAMGDLWNQDQPDLERRQLFSMQSNLIMAADHPLAPRRQISLSDLSLETFVGVWRHELTERTLEGAFRSAGQAVPQVIDCDNFMVTRGLLLDEGCLVLSNRLFFDRELRSGAVVEREIPGLSYRVDYAIFYRRDTVLGRATLGLIDEIGAVARERFVDAPSVSFIADL